MNNKKILLVEDSIAQLASLKLALSKTGCDIITAKDGAEGISVAYQIQPDIIVSDILMPEINGYQFCRLLKNDATTKDIPIILLTALSEKLDKFWGMKAGANAFLTKDGNMENLLEVVNNFLNTIKHITEEQRQKILQERKLFTTTSIQAKVKQILDQSLIESTIINEFRYLSEFVRNTRVLNKELILLMSSILDYNIAGIFFNARDEKKRTLVLSISDISSDKVLCDNIKRDFFNTLLPDDFSLNQEDYIYEIFDGDDQSSGSAPNLDEFKSKVIIPIIYAEKVLGGICLYHTDPDKFNPSRIFNIIIEELKVLMRIRWLYSETKYLTITDGLTGLYNRRYFQQALEREYARAVRYGTCLSIAMFDIDHFKKLNDTYGHQFGDKVIAEISAIIKKSLRRTDYVTRYGGEEFFVILPETNLENTAIPIERIRKKIEEADFKYYDQQVRTTISVGIASLTSDVANEDDFVRRADTALYKAKENGRNRVELCTEK